MVERFFTRRSRRGANAIEFGLTAPVFFAMILGLMDYGWLFANQAGIDNAASLGCRDGALVDPEVGDPVATANAEILARSSLFCDANCSHSVVDLNSGAYAVPNRTLLCTVTMDFSALVGMVPTPSTLTSTSYYRFEWQRQ